MNEARHPGILVLGSANTDLVLRLPSLPKAGETVLGGEFLQVAGGKGANQAVAAARAGLGRVTFLAAVGDDEFGRQAVAGYAAAGIDCRFIQTIAGAATGTALILVDRGGENIIGVASGANAQLTAAQIDLVPDEVFRNAKVFLASLETPLATVLRGLQRAREAGLMTLLNPAPAVGEVCDRRILELVDVLTPNEGEAATITGRSPIATASNDALVVDEARNAAVQLRASGATAVVVTLGRAGCLVAADQVTHLRGMAVDAVDTTAAGDAFNGALAVALADGKPLAAAAAWANRAAAIAVTRVGAQPSLPRRELIEQFLSGESPPG